MAKDFLGLGWRFPVNVDSKGKIIVSSYEEDIQEAIRIIVGTSKGERIMRPDFGCGIFDYVFAPLDTSTIGLIESSVREALVMWEPRIELENVNVSHDITEAEKLLITIDYRVRTTNNRFNLVYPFYLSENK
jgi:phage baseplate assembly protein W